jgi:hypothetical protein
MLKQISVLMESIKDGSRTESEVNKEIESLIQSLGIISPEVSGLVEVELTREDFYNLIKSVEISKSMKINFTLLDYKIYRAYN